MRGAALLGVGGFLLVAAGLYLPALTGTTNLSPPWRSPLQLTLSGVGACLTLASLLRAARVREPLTSERLSLPRARQALAILMLVSVAATALQWYHLLS